MNTYRLVAVCRVGFLTAKIANLPLLMTNNNIAITNHLQPTN